MKNGTLPPAWHQAHAMLSATSAALDLAKLAGWEDVETLLRAAFDRGLVLQAEIFHSLKREPA